MKTIGSEKILFFILLCVRVFFTDGLMRRRGRGSGSAPAVEKGEREAKVQRPLATANM